MLVNKHSPACAYASRHSTNVSSEYINGRHAMLRGQKAYPFELLKIASQWCVNRCVLYLSPGIYMWYQLQIRILHYL